MIGGINLIQDNIYTDGTRPINHKIRKLSVTISLSHPDEYEGGNLEFDFRNQVDWDRNKNAYTFM